MRFQVLALLVATLFFGYFTFLFSASVSASPYGEGAYGDCEYGETCPTPTPTQVPGSSSQSNNTSSANNSVSTSCSDTPPSSAPHLFQIDRQGDTAKLYFSPAGSPYNKYILIYGFSEADERFSVSFDRSNSPGVIMFTIQRLSPKTTYYFKVRAGYGCAIGAWSNSMRVGSVSGRNIASFYPQKNSIINRINTVYNNVKTRLLSPKPTLQVPPQTPPTATQQPVITPKIEKKVSSPKSTAQPVKQSFWDKILSFF